MLAQVRTGITLARDNADPGQVEAVALALAALIAANPAEPLVRRALDWLQAQRRGASWGTPEATSAALWALTAAGGSERTSGERSEVTVAVNGREVATIQRDGEPGLLPVEVPAALVRDRDNRISLRVRVGARCTTGRCSPASAGGSANKTAATTWCGRAAATCLPSAATTVRC